MKFLSILVLIYLFISPALPNSAQVASHCDDRAKIIAELQIKYDEKIKAIGVLKGSKQLLEIYADKKGNWTAIVSAADNKKACIVASGKSWMQIKEPMPKA